MHSRANIALVGLFGLAIITALFGMAYYIDAKWEVERQAYISTLSCPEGHRLTRFHRAGPYYCVLAPIVKKDI